MNSSVHGIGSKHSHKNKTKWKKSKCRGWISTWSYSNRMQKVTKKNPKQNNMWKQILLTLLLPESAWVILWDFFCSFYNFPGWLNFSLTLQIQKQTVATGAHLSQQSQNHTLLFSPPAPPSTLKSQNWGHCLTFCTVQPEHAWDFATWGCQLQNTHQNQNGLRHHCHALRVILCSTDQG